MPFALLLILLILGQGLSAKADSLKFAKFFQNESHLPSSHKRHENTFDELTTDYIHSFSIVGGECKIGSYGNGTSKGDCSYDSVRSMLRELNRKGQWDFSQPAEARYGWDMMIPNIFPTRGDQTRGGFIFAQWKGFVCPHISLAHSTDPTEANQLYLRLQVVEGDPGDFDCSDVKRIPLLRMGRDAFKGEWHNFEVFAEWSHQSDGQLLVFIDGQQVAKYKGPTLNQDPNGSNRKAKSNHFAFGGYLCYTDGIHLIKIGTLYFANVQRASSKEGLRK